MGGEEMQLSSGFAEENEINILDIFKILWARKLLVIVVITIFTIAAVFHAKNLTDVYTAEVTLLPVSSDGVNISGGIGALGGLASLAGFSTSGGGDVTENIATIKSRIFIMDFLSENKLLPTLYANKWDEKNGKWLTDENVKEPSLQQGYKFFSKSVMNILENKKTGLVTLQVNWHDPVQAARWANLLVLKANAFLKEKAVSESNESIIFLKDQIQETTEVGIQTLLYKLLEKELQTIKLASVRKDYAFKVLDPALVPENPGGPNRMMICMIGLMLGFVVAIFLALALNMLANKNSKADAAA